MNARTNTRTYILRLGAMAAALAVAVVILILIAADLEPVSATQPPPPVYYTVTINRSGGGDCTKFYFDAPVVTDPSSWSVQRSIQAGSQVWIGAFAKCPCVYRFDHWEINGEEVDDGGPYNLTMFYLSENTTATALFVPKKLPNQESTTWKEHWTTAPHWGDAYEHQVSMASDPGHKFTGMTINEDFLKSEMTSSGWTVPSTPDYKQQWQNAWDGDWEITSTNARDDADAHGFNPKATRFRSFRECV